MNNFTYNKSPSPQMHSTNVQIHSSCLTQDESKYPVQWNEKGSDEKTSYFLKMRAKPRKAMAYGWENSNKMVGRSQSIYYHIKEQKIPVKEQVNFLEKDTTVLL